MHRGHPIGAIGRQDLGDVQRARRRLFDRPPEPTVLSARGAQDHPGQLLGGDAKRFWSPCQAAFRRPYSHPISLPCVDSRDNRAVPCLPEHCNSQRSSLISHVDHLASVNVVMLTGTASNARNGPRMISLVQAVASGAASDEQQRCETDCDSTHGGSLRTGVSGVCYDNRSQPSGGNHVLAPGLSVGGTQRCRLS